MAGSEDADRPHPDEQPLADILQFPSLGVEPKPADRPTHGTSLRHVIGEVLREERHEQGRTLADVAEHAAVSLPYLSEVERGVKDVSSEVLTAISDALALPLPEVLDRSARRLRADASTATGALTHHHMPSNWSGFGTPHPAQTRPEQPPLNNWSGFGTPHPAQTRPEQPPLRAA